MMCYVWEDESKVTTSWHDEGGLLVIAESLFEARGMIAHKCPEGCSALENDPDFTFSTDHTSPVLIVFPNTGCC